MSELKVSVDASLENLKVICSWEDGFSVRCDLFSYAKPFLKFPSSLERVDPLTICPHQHLRQFAVANQTSTAINLHAYPQ